MVEDRYFVIMNMETHIHKNDLALGCVDTDGKIRNEVLKKLEEHFPSSTYDRTETLDAIIYSIKESLPAKPIMDLRNLVLILLDIEQDSYQKDKDDELNTHFKDSVIADIVKESQHCHYLYTVIYNFFRWRSYEGSIPIQRDGCRYESSLNVTQYGIQIYLSAPDFTSEFEGELRIMLNPLRHILNRVSNPFNNILSIQIERAPQF